MFSRLLVGLMLATLAACNDDGPIDEAENPPPPPAEEQALRNGDVELEQNAAEDEAAVDEDAAAEEENADESDE